MSSESEEEIDVDKMFKEDNGEKEENTNTNEKKEETKKNQKEEEKSFEELIVEIGKFNNTHLRDHSNLLKKIIEGLENISEQIDNLELTSSNNSLPTVSGDNGGLPVVSGDDSGIEIDDGKYYPFKGEIIGQSQSGKGVKIKLKNGETTWAPKSEKGLKPGWAKQTDIIQEFGIKGWKVKQMIEEGSISKNMVEDPIN